MKKRRSLILSLVVSLLICGLIMGGFPLFPSTFLPAAFHRTDGYRGGDIDR
ncbi:hypothetical protein [[Clostridium] innocuum]|uniref:hypothetical protein n=1 Tax=Clostridium innocuum TaxID=1522 RepID=UPI001F29DEF1|nr:hypothetical protein [[Clostridium] innocuum]